MTFRQIAACTRKIEIRTYNKIALLANMFGSKMELKNPMGEGEFVTTRKEVSEDPKLSATIDREIARAQVKKKEEMKRRGR
jgi:hypothetical protein